MAFWNREQVPKELEGIDPQEIVRKLNEAKELQTQLEAAKADVTKSQTELQTLQAQAATNDQRIKELEAKVNNPPPPEKKTTDEPPSIFTEPEKFIQQQTQDTQNVAYLSGILSAKMYAKQSLSQRDVKIFNKYEKDIDGIVNSYPPQQRILPQIWVNALTYIKGAHEMDIRKAEGEGGEFFAEVPTTRDAPQPTGSQDKLTAEEEEACDKFHWDKKKYLENKKKATAYGSSHLGFGGSNG